MCRPPLAPTPLFPSEKTIYLSRDSVITFALFFCTSGGGVTNLQYLSSKFTVGSSRNNLLAPLFYIHPASYRPPVFKEELT